MPLPTITGTASIDRYACEYFWVYTESDSVGGVTVKIDALDPVTATAGTDPNDVEGWRVLIAGSLCPTPGSAIVLAPGGHTLHAWQTDAPETHAYRGSIRIT